ncbi:MAG TPA: NADH-quinone oxidoreductase subunit NuoH [Chthonomonadaceae bacterium]|nr:NADH-quinone oxidoreductase subunit NuoH [Chthonomonadaceae bacterium]
MSVPQPFPNRATPAGQRALGLLITLFLLAIVSLLPKLPWHLLDPVTQFIGDRPLLNALVKAAIVANFIAVQCLFLIWLERKFAGWMQARLGPMHVGWKGTFQTLADAVKLLLKEDVIPADADRPLFVLAPYLVFVPTVLTFMVLPFSLAWVGYDYGLAALFVVSISTTAALGILAAGWGSNNKYSLVGGVRAVAQLLSYEIPMILVVLSVVTLADTFSLTQIVQKQAGLWNIVAHPVLLIPGFLIYLACALAEVNRSPFDLPEAESELVSGFHTEYSGMRFAFFFLAEFANNFFTAGFAAVLFFGGWLGPGLLPPVVWFTLKVLLLIVLMMWVRWTLPRLRIDQMMGFCWKLLVPLALLLFCATAVRLVM